MKKSLAADERRYTKIKSPVFWFLAFICVHLRLAFLFPTAFLGRKLRRLAAARAIDVRRVVRQQGHTLLVTDPATRRLVLLDPGAASRLALDAAEQGKTGGWIFSLPTPMSASS